MSDAYWTMNTEYIESVWWSLKQLHERGLLFQADKVTTYCPRCGTALSDARGRAGLHDRSRTRACTSSSGSSRRATRRSSARSLLGWTTTPWTLISNTGVAVAGDASYVVVEHGGRPADPGAEAPKADVLGGRSRSWVRRSRAAPSSALRYEPLYPNVEGAHRVVAGDFVSLDDGTGVVHIAPAFGAEDLEIGTRARAGRCSSRSTTRAGSPTRRPRSSAGVFVKDADADDHRGPPDARPVAPRRRRSSTRTRSAGGAARPCSTSRASPGTSGRLR